MPAHTAFFAHSTDRTDGADWQPVAEHVRAVTTLAAERPAKFGAGEWGWVQ